MPRYPQIKRIVQKQIGQDRGHDTALRRAFATSDLPARGLHRRFQPAFHVEQNLRLLTVLAQSPHHEVVFEFVEQPADVELYNPVVVPASASGDSDRLQRRFSRAITIEIIAEDRIKPWLQPHLHRHRRLRDPVGHCRDANSRTRCLYTGCRLAHKQVSSRLISAQHHSPVSTSFEHFRYLSGSSLVFAFLSPTLCLAAPFP